MTQTGRTMPLDLEFWFEFGSNYSYLSVMRIEAMAAHHGVRIVWKPFLLGPVFKRLGWDASPFVLQKEKGLYVWRDMARRCEAYGLPWTRPSVFPRSALLPMRVALIGAERPWIAAYSKRMMQLNFVSDREIDTTETVTQVLDELGLPADELIAQACSGHTKLRLREQTDEAMARGLFGAPTFMAGSEMFWGDDRLDDALRWAACGGGSGARSRQAGAHGGVVDREME